MSVDAYSVIAALFNEEFVLTAIMRHSVDTRATFRLNPPPVAAVSATNAATTAEPVMSPKLKTIKQQMAEHIKVA